MRTEINDQFKLLFNIKPSFISVFIVHAFIVHTISIFDILHSIISVRGPLPLNKVLL